MSFCWFSGSTVRMLIRVVTFFRYLYGRVHDVLHSLRGKDPNSTAAIRKIPNFRHSHKARLF
jgi:hypothetical protein